MKLVSNKIAFCPCSCSSSYYSCKSFAPRQLCADSRYNNISSTKELPLTVFKILDTEMLITLMFDSKQALNEMASPFNAIWVTWFSMHMRISYHFLVCFVCRVLWVSRALCMEFDAGGTPCHSVPFQFKYVSTTTVPLSIIVSTNSMWTEFTAGDTPRHSVHFSFSSSLWYQHNVEVQKCS